MLWNDADFTMDLILSRINKTDGFCFMPSRAALGCDDLNLTLQIFVQVISCQDVGRPNL